MQSRGSRRLLLRTAIALAFGACGLFIEASASAQPCDDCQARHGHAVSPQAMSAEQRLADKYVPIVYLRNQREPCDKRGSPYAPVPVEFLFDIEEIVLRRHADGRTTDEARAFSAEELYGKGDEYFIDLPGNPKRPGCRYEQDYLARTEDYTPVAYAHIAREDGHDGFALQYWLFYYFNDWNNKHEGDWEMVQLTFDGPSPADALEQEPTGVGFSQHGGGEHAAWDDDKLSKEGNHPIAHAAAGANANLYEASIILGRGENGMGFGCDDASRPSRPVELEARLMEEPTGPTSEYAWLAYDGRWGERAPWEFNGPTGPNDKRAWREPFSWQEDLRPSSIKVPTDSTIGPNAVNFFCDAIWVLSTPLFVVFRIPPALLLGGLVACLIGVVFTATRTSYRPVVVPPLRRQRRFGQVLTASARVYRRHVWLFAGIGALFVPAGLVETALQWLLFLPPFADTVAGFFSSSLAAEAAIALTIGNLASSIVYWFVSVASTAAVARIDAGRQDTLADNARDLARRLPGLLAARLKALAVVVLLSITIVGVPWAVRHAIRWAFIEETMVLDGTPSSDALATSARAVDGHWWHAFRCLVILSLLGFFTGPAIAMILLLASSASVSVINLVSSLVFAAIVPFVAVCQALLYFHFTASHTSSGEEAFRREHGACSLGA
jgi:hypothetical protein